MGERVEEARRALAEAEAAEKAAAKHVELAAAVRENPGDEKAKAAYRKHVEAVAAERTALRVQEKERQDAVATPDTVAASAEVHEPREE